MNSNTRHLIELSQTELETIAGGTISDLQDTISTQINAVLKENLIPPIPDLKLPDQLQTITLD